MTESDVEDDFWRSFKFHDVALYLGTSLGGITLCHVIEDLQKSLWIHTITEISRNY